MDEIKVENRRKYMQSPDHCPCCGSDEIEGSIAIHSSSIDIDAGGAWQSVSCCDCGAEWHDIYTLTHVELVVAGNETEAKESEG